jgi:hypothetical protein
MEEGKETKKFTGQKDVDVKILNLLEDKDLISLCETNKYVNSICNNDTFWRDRIVNKYGKEALIKLKETNGITSYKEFYTSGKVKTYLTCLQIAKLPHSSQLVVDDFYNPFTGFIKLNLLRSFTVQDDFSIYLLLKIVLTRITSFPIRDFSYEESLKALIQQSYSKIYSFSQRNLDPKAEFLTAKERELFLNIISLEANRGQLLIQNAKANPFVVKALSPRPEDKFAIIAHIHRGFQTGEIPLDILWEELCTLPFVLNFNK